MSRSYHELNSDFPKTLKKVYEDLREQSTNEIPKNAILVQQNGLQFLGLWTGLRQNFNPQDLRQAVGTLTRQAENYRLVQVVGDSGCQISQDGIDKAKAIIGDLVDGETLIGQQTVLEYGYTASKHDANWIVNDLVTNAPLLGNRVIANIVYMSAIAVESWNCEATSHVRNFVLAYDNATETAFGSDMWLSDSVMNASFGDKMVCIEGGPQAFAQAVSVCAQGVPVVALTGSDMRAEPSRRASVSFSAAHLLTLLKRSWQQHGTGADVSQEEKDKIETVAMTYLHQVGEFGSSNKRSRQDLIVSSLHAVLSNLMCLDHVEVVIVK